MTENLLVVMLHENQVSPSENAFMTGLGATKGTCALHGVEIWREW